MKTDYKKLYEEQLLKEHTKRYIHIPFSWKGIGLFFLTLLSIGLNYLNILFLVNSWNFLDLKSLDVSHSYSLHQLLIGFPLILQYLFMVGFFICLIAMFKGGFNNLKSFNDDGLIVGLISGLIFGIIVGLIGGLIVGLIVGLIGGLIVGLIGGLIVGLISGLIFGLIGGLIGEYNE